MAQPSVPYLLLGSLFFLLAGLGFTAILPGLEPYPLSGGAAPYTELQRRGRTVYIREGCVYCHTQQVRSVEAGTGTVHAPGDIGPESQPGDYAHQSPVLWGTERQGPDLAHVASRSPGNSVPWQLAHLKDPQLLSPGTLMPSFRHLPQSDLEALVGYLMTLR